MVILIALLVVLLGYIIFLQTIGFITLTIRISVPVTRVLQKIGLLKYNLHIFWALCATIVFPLISITFYSFLNEVFQYLLLGYCFGVVIIIKNFKKKYTFNKYSFTTWYLSDYYDQFDFSRFSKDEASTFKNVDTLFDFVATILKAKKEGRCNKKT
ncbi:hypothetical protein ACFL49_00605 [Candidatus Omnitrophota bacterium]